MSLSSLWLFASRLEAIANRGVSDDAAMELCAIATALRSMRRTKQFKVSVPFAAVLSLVFGVGWIFGAVVGRIVCR